MTTTDNAYAFAVQVRRLNMLRAPVLPDALLEALGDYYQEQRPDCDFELFCRRPHWYGFLRPVRTCPDIWIETREMCIRDTEWQQRPKRIHRFLAGWMRVMERTR